MLIKKIKLFFEKLFIDSKFKEEIEFLRRVPLFSDLSNKSLGKILNICNKKKYETNEIVFNEGTTGKIFYIIKSGEIIGIKNDKIVYKLHSGDHFGEMTLLEETARVLTTKATEDSELLLIYKVKFDGFLQDDPVAGVKILQKFIKKFSHIIRQMSDR